MEGTGEYKLNMADHMGSHRMTERGRKMEMHTSEHVCIPDRQRNSVRETEVDEERRQRYTHAPHTSDNKRFAPDEVDSPEERQAPSITCHMSHVTPQL